MNSDEPTQTQPLDQPASRARLALIAGSVLLVAGIVYSAVTSLDWLTWLMAHGWALTLVLIVVVLAGLFLFDITRAKNVAWRSLNTQFGEDFSEALDRQNFATGHGLVGDYTYSGLRCFGSPKGIEINRIVKFVNPPLYIPWSAITKIDTFPSLLTGRKDFETDMQARITLSAQPDVAVEIPWLTEYRQLLPKSVKYRAIKLSKK